MRRFLPLLALAACASGTDSDPSKASGDDTDTAGGGSAGDGGGGADGEAGSGEDGSRSRHYPRRRHPSIESKVSVPTVEYVAYT